jgi:hypothetical protein
MVAFKDSKVPNSLSAYHEGGVGTQEAEMDGIDLNCKIIKLHYDIYSICSSIISVKNESARLRFKLNAENSKH